MFTQTHVISPRHEIGFLIERILYPGIQIRMISSLRFRNFCQAMMNSTEQLAHLRSSINQCYIGERIHLVFLLCVYFCFVQNNGVRREIKITPRGMWEYEYVPERSVIIYSLFPKIKITRTVQNVCLSGAQNRLLGTESN